MSRNLNKDFTLNNCLFGYVKLTKNADPDKYKYMRSSVHIDNNNKDILIIGEGRTQGSNDTTLTVEAKYSINFTQPRKRFVLSLHYSESNSFLFVNATKIYQFKAKDFYIKDYALFLGNISKDFTINNTKTAGLKGNVKFFLLILILLILMIFQICINI